MRGQARWMGGVVLIATLTMTRPSLGEESHEPTVDPLLPTGLVLAGLGTTAAVVGGVLVATAEDVPGTCVTNAPVVGCTLVDTNRMTDHELAGRLLLGSGVGMAVLGSVLAIAAAVDPVPSDEYRSVGAAVTGALLVGLAGASLGFGFGSIGERWSGRDQEFFIYPPLGAGGLLLDIGAPLLAAGRARVADGATGRPVPARDRGDAMVLNGAILTVGGLIGAGTNAAVFVAAEGGFIFGYPLISGIAQGGIMLLTGIPVWIAGAAKSWRDGTAEEAGANGTTAPVVQVGPGSVDLRWRF